MTSFSPTEELDAQAVALQLAEASEPGAVNFLAADCRVFRGIVRKKVWHHITQAEEDRALAALRKYRQEDTGGASPALQGPTHILGRASLDRAVWWVKAWGMSPRLKHFSASGRNVFGTD